LPIDEFNTTGYITQKLLELEAWLDQLCSNDSLGSKPFDRDEINKNYLLPASKQNKY
jgi:hypothetical protein